VVVSDCVIKDSHRGVAVRLSLGGSIERVLFSNLIIETRIFDPMWWGRGEPIQVLALPWTEATQARRDPRHPVLEPHLQLRERRHGLRGQPGHIENISFDRVSVHVSRPASFEGGQQDLRPNAAEGLPRMGTSGFLLRDAAGVTLRDCSVTWGPSPPDYFHFALEAKGCPGLDDSGLSGQAAHPGTPARSIQ
jgi:hypothetical protein